MLKILFLITICLYVNLADEVTCEFSNPGRELFMWAILLNRKDLALIFWKACPDHIGMNKYFTTRVSDAGMRARCIKCSLNKRSLASLVSAQTIMRSRLVYIQRVTGRGHCGSRSVVKFI